MADSRRDPADLSDLRAAIDALDRRLLEVLNQRIEIAREIGARKATTGAPVYVAPREKAVLRGLLRANKGPLTTESLLRVYREVFAASRGAETALKIAYPGAPGGLGHAAATGLFGATTATVAAGGADAALGLVARRGADYAVLPSIVAPEGVADFAVLHLLRLQLYLVAEYYLPLDLGIALPPRRKVTRQVFVPPAFGALAAERLPGLLPAAKITAATDIPAAAAAARETPGAGALVPRFAADEAGLRVRETVLGPSEGRSVRYLVAGREPAAASGSDKTTLAFGLVNQAGNLQRALRPFSRRRINVALLTAGTGGTWGRGDIFFLDFEGHLDSDRIRKTVEEMREVCSFVEVLGSYPVFDLAGRAGA